MLVRWTQGDDHGLVWEHGLAVLSGEVDAEAARRLWTEFAVGGDLAAFLKALSAGTGADLLSLPDFAIALRVSGGWQLAARGALEARAANAGVRGEGISTWAERFVAGSGPIAVGQRVRGGGERPIVAGLVPAVALTWDGATEAPGCAATAEQAVAVSPASVPPEPDASPQAPEPSEPDASPAPEHGDSATIVGDQEALLDLEAEASHGQEASEDADPTPDFDPRREADEHPGDPSVEAEEDRLESAPLGQGRFARQFGQTQVVSVETAAVRDRVEDLFISAVPKAGADVPDQGDHDGHTMMAAPADLAAVLAEPSPPADSGDGPLVLGVRCERGHANPPQRSCCTLCGAELNAEPGRVPRPSLGRVLLPNGEHLELTGPVIIGRNPRADRVPGGAVPRLVPLSQGHISGTHLELKLEDWNVLAVDLRSTNGTFLRRVGEAPVRLGERPELLIAGDVLDLGHGVQLVVEQLR